MPGENMAPSSPAATLFRDLAQAQVDEPLLVAALYRTRGPVRLEAPPLVFVVKQLVRIISRKVRRTVEHVLVAMSDKRLFLFEVIFKPSGWTIRRPIGTWARDTITCGEPSEEPLALELRLPGEDAKLRLFPYWVTPEVAQLARALIAAPG